MMNVQHQHCHDHPDENVTDKDPYRPTRPIMTSDELAQHHVRDQGRDYNFASPDYSDDGYGDMAVASKYGWRAISGWGRDGWDLGDWPLVVVSVRDMDGRYEMRQTVEGDSSIYRFDTPADREAAIDYLFLWYAFGHSGSLSDAYGRDAQALRSALDAGTLRVESRHRGPFSWARCDAA